MMFTTMTLLAIVASGAARKYKKTSVPFAPGTPSVDPLPPAIDSLPPPRPSEPQTLRIHSETHWLPDTNTDGERHLIHQGAQPTDLQADSFKAVVYPLDPIGQMLVPMIAVIKPTDAEQSLNYKAPVAPARWPSLQENQLIGTQLPAPGTSLESSKSILASGGYITPGKIMTQWSPDGFISPPPPPGPASPVGVMRHVLGGDARERKRADSHPPGKHRVANI